MVLDGQQHFSAWHTFLIVCAVPTPLAIIGLLALPESPRILLEIGHEREALVIYQVIEKKLSLLVINGAQLQLVAVGAKSPFMDVSSCCFREYFKKITRN